MYLGKQIRFDSPRWKGRESSRRAAYKMFHAFVGGSGERKFLLRSLRVCRLMYAL